MPLVLMGRAPWRVDVEARGVALSLRAVPLTEHGQRVGAVLLCRDVSELRRRERELITKDATIREIHHRVKNNLQTVAALLRLQSRRVDSPEAKEALGEAMRRVATIALVHETLSQTLDESVPFDDLVGRSLRLAADVATEGAHVRTLVRGSFGSIPRRGRDRARPDPHRAGDQRGRARVRRARVGDGRGHRRPSGRRSCGSRWPTTAPGCRPSGAPAPGSARRSSRRS